MDGPDEVVRTPGLEQEALDPRGEGAVDGGRVVERGEDDEGGPVSARGGEPFDGAEPVEDRHAEVDQGDVGAGGGDRAQELLAVGRLGDDRDTARLEDRAEVLPRVGVVVGDHDPQATHRRSRRAVTRPSRTHTSKLAWASGRLPSV